MRFTAPQHLHASHSHTCSLSHLDAILSFHICSPRIRSLRRRLPILIILLALVGCLALFTLFTHASVYSPSLIDPTRHSEMNSHAQMNAVRLAAKKGSLAELPAPLLATPSFASLSTTSDLSIPSLDSALPSSTSSSSDTDSESSDESEAQTPEKERSLLLLPQLRRVQKYRNLRRAALPAIQEYAEVDSTTRDPGCPQSPIARSGSFDAASPSLFSLLASTKRVEEAEDPIALAHPLPSDDGPYPAPPASSDEDLVYLALPCNIKLSGSLSTRGDSTHDRLDFTASFGDEEETEEVDDVKLDEQLDLIDELQDEEEENVMGALGFSPLWLVFLLVFLCVGLLMCFLATGQEQIL